jgi:nicotinamide-nucleotide amidase
MFATAEIVVVGSEFFTRFKPDSNSIWLTEQLERRGVRVLAKRIVADHLEALVDAFTQATQRVDLVISTGGLGPTEDDRTREAVAAACGRRLCFHQEIVDDIQAKFAQRGRVPTGNNERQAYIPEGAEILHNLNGTAPGFFLSVGSGTLLVLPGPPREMTALYQAFAQRASASFPNSGTVTASRVLKVTGLGESDMDGRIADLYRELDNPEVTINFTPNDLEIHLTARAETVEAAEALLEPLLVAMAERLQGFLFSTEGATLAEVVSQRLRRQGLTVALAESLTGGMVCHRLASIAGASDILAGGLVAYTESAKQALLGVKPETLEQHSVVSEAVAREMAEGAYRIFGCSLALSCTGYAGPTGGTPEDPVGTAYIGLCREGETRVLRVCVPGDRNLVRKRVAQAMLFWLYRETEPQIEEAGAFAPASTD